MKILTTFLLAVAVSTTTFASQAGLTGRLVARDATVTDASKSCATYCVSFVGERLGVDGLGFEAIDETVDPDGDGVASLASIVATLRGAGLEVTPRRASRLDQIPPGLNILHVRSRPDGSAMDHFLVTDELRSGRFRVFQPPLGSAVVDADRLEKLWDGTFVRISQPDAKSRLAPGVWGTVFAVLLGGISLLLRQRRAAR